MAKVKTVYHCSECGQETSGWLGRCPGCSSWNTLVETQIKPAKPNLRQTRTWTGQPAEEAKIIRLSQVDQRQNRRLASGLAELDRVLGGGFVPGSLVLIGGDPGVGKSTLLLQVLGKIAKKEKTLYISGEESAQQVRLRADRLQIDSDKIDLLTATAFDTVQQALIEQQPDLAIIDSIQTLYLDELSAAPGSVSQVREATAGLLRIAKERGIAIVLVGHVTKDGAIAGPRVLEHMVDTVLYFEGEKQYRHRLIRAVKNRFGATDEIGLFEMSDRGLIPVENASRIFLQGRPRQVSGSVVTACMEGTRPLLVEIQALLNPTAYASPQRMAQGFERNRFILLLAVLDKNFQFNLDQMDAYINVVGGLRLTETAADLAIAAAIVSSLKDRPVRDDALVFGEIGLGGEIRSVAQPQRRIAEASRLGFSTFILPGGSRQALEESKLSEACELIYVDRISEAFDVLLT